MAASMTIIVLCPEGRRQKIKATPNTSVLEVLEEACRKQGIKPEDYDICHYTTTLDPSLSLRFANIPNNAMLELNPTKHFRQEGSVTVCLQLESGDRVTDDFSPSASVWDIIQKCYCTENKSLKGEPICIYMRQKIFGDNIKKTTLRSLGLTSGKAILRLMFREPETFNEQAHVSQPITKPVPFKNEPITQLKKTAAVPVNVHQQMSIDSSDIIKRMKTENSNYDYAQQQNLVKPSISCSDEVMMETNSDVNANASVTPVNPVKHITKTHTNTVGRTANVASSAVHSSNDSEMMEVDNSSHNNEKPIGKIIYVGARNALLFNLEDISEVRKTDLPDDFFELTVDDVRYLMTELKNQRMKFENAPLMLRSQRESVIFQQLACYKQTVLRIYFPDKFVLQGTFIAEETVQSVTDFVKSFLEDKTLNFYLYITPPKTTLQLDSSLIQARLVPAAIIYFGCDSACSNYLRADVKSQISDPRAAAFAAAECRKQKIPHTDRSMAVVPNSETIQNPIIKEEKEELQENVQRYIPPKSDSKAPKWFQLGRK